MKLISNQKVGSAEVSAANFSQAAVDNASLRSDVDVKANHVYVMSLPQKCHGETTKRGNISNRILMFDINKDTAEVTPINMPHSLLQSIFIALAAEWGRDDRIKTETRYAGNDKSKPYLRPDAMYTPATENGNIQFEAAPGELNMQYSEPFAIECLGVVDTIGARYDAQAPKLHGNITPLVTFEEDGKVFAKTRAQRTPIFRRVEASQLQALLAEDAIPTTKDALKAAFSGSAEDKKFYSAIESYLL